MVCLLLASMDLITEITADGQWHCKKVKWFEFWSVIIYFLLVNSRHTRLFCCFKLDMDCLWLHCWLSRNDLLNFSVHNCPPRCSPHFLLVILTFGYYWISFRSEKGTYYALDLGGTNFRVLRVQLGGNSSDRSAILRHDVDRQAIPPHLMTSTSEVIEFVTHCSLTPEHIFSSFDLLMEVI